MENHPIPQDVTGFQFKLIGEMTVKQFAYVAGGVVLAWIVFSLPLLFFIKLIIALILLFIGFSLAFVPIEGRPMDVMLSHFTRALFVPSRYVYRKIGALFIPPAQAPSSPLPPPPSPPSPPPPPTPLPLSATAVASDANTTPLDRPSVQSPTSSLSDLQEQLENALSEKQRLEKALEEIKNNLSDGETLSPADQTPQALPPPVIPHPPPPPPLPKTTVVELSSNAVASDAIPPPTTVYLGDPNIITGTIKDAKGNVLPNILVEVEDKDGNPVRAFRTNPLGQFASATPLLNGVYAVALEDPRKIHRFSPFEITIQGQVLPPFIICAIDERDELRKTLFGGNT